MDRRPRGLQYRGHHAVRLPGGYAPGPGRRYRYPDLPRTLGLHPVPTNRVILVGARAIDPGERNLLEHSGVEQRGLDVSPTDLHDGDLYLHIDIDICDPTVVPDLLFPTPGGPGLDAVVDVVQRLMATGQIAAPDRSLPSTWPPAGINGPAAPTQRQVIRRMNEAVTS